MRAYLTGVTSTSIWTPTRRGERTFCGHALPDGHEEEPAARARRSSRRRPRPSRGDHDVSASREELSRGARSTADDFDARRDCARAVRASARARARARADPGRHQVRDGRAPDGELVVIDEIHTPDSSRYWYADDYEERLAAGRGAAEPRQGVRAALAGRRSRLPRRRPAAAAARRRPRRGRAALHRDLRAGHRPAVRPRDRRPPCARIRRNLQLDLGACP